MKLLDFEYDLPKELIAQYPSKERGYDRLLVLERGNKSFYEKMFTDITGYFSEGDVIVMNDTKVLPARLYGRRKTGARVEIFVIDKTKVPVEALVRPSGRIAENEVIELDSGDTVKVCGRSSIGRYVEFNSPVDEVMKRAGHVPLPPYITRTDEPEDRERYQTVFAKKEGATASPTAGIHFTNEIMNKLREQGVGIVFVTLHVSYGTFAPVKEEQVENHKMHSEYYSISRENIGVIHDARNAGKKICACGTTSLRVVETCADKIINYMPKNMFCQDDPSNARYDGFTNLFIYPGYEFRIITSMITNFHLPKSTLLLLVSAFCGKELIFDAYKYAIKNKFSFFSYGDAMLIM